MRYRLPGTRWALAPPFHPYRVNAAVYFLWHFLSLPVRQSPGVTRYRALWSPDFPRNTRHQTCTRVARCPDQPSPPALILVFFILLLIFFLVIIIVTKIFIFIFIIVYFGRDIIVPVNLVITIVVVIFVA
jgi:hypothetical protein